MDLLGLRLLSRLLPTIGLLVMLGITSWEPSRAWFLEQVMDRANHRVDNRLNRIVDNLPALRESPTRAGP